MPQQPQQPQRQQSAAALTLPQEQRMPFLFSLPNNKRGGQPWATCAICQLVLQRTDVESLTRHLEGKKHRAAAAAAAAATPAAAPGTSASPSPSPSSLSPSSLSPSEALSSPSAPSPSCPLSVLKPSPAPSAAPSAPVASTAVTPQQLELTLGDAKKILSQPTSSASSCKQGLQHRQGLQTEGADSAERAQATGPTGPRAVPDGAPHGASFSPARDLSQASSSVRLTDRQPTAPFWCKSCHHSTPTQKKFDQHLSSQRHRDQEAVYLRGIYEGVAYFAFALEKASATDSLPPVVSHESVTSAVGLPPSLPAAIDAADHTHFLRSLNQLVEASTTDIRSALCAQEQDRRWTRFLDALRAGVPSVLDYELQCAVDEEDEEDHEAAGDIYEGYGDSGGEGIEDAYYEY